MCRDIRVTHAYKALLNPDVIGTRYVFPLPGAMV